MFMEFSSKLSHSIFLYALRMCIVIKLNSKKSDKCITMMRHVTRGVHMCA